MIRRFGVILSTAMLAGVMLMTATPASATHDDGSCADVTLIFARGSGQTLGQREAPEYLARLTDRLRGVTVNAYELGTEAHGGGQYRAVGITGSLQSYKNLLEAELSWTGGLGGEYRESVASGVTELTSYLTDRAASCPDEVFAVGGYSQGAQTVGDGIASLPRSVRDRVAHVALLGDPKLYLPEGRGPLPSACRGKGFSPWRRGNVSCWTDNGILEGRVPYVPTDIESRTGSWCDREDPICNGNLGDFISSAHGSYADDGAELDEAVVEAAEAIAGAIPEKAADFDLMPILLAVGSDGLDVAFIIDTTGSMSGRIGAARATAQELGDMVVSLGGRVALTEYRDAGDPFVAEVRSPLTTDIASYRTALDGLFASGGGDTPEALLTALMRTFDGLSWKDGATKAAVVLTDASYHDPDRAEGWTLSDVVARSLEIDPVNVYPVVPSFLAGTYGPLAEGTAGEVVVDSGNTAEALRQAFVSVTTRPVVSFDIWEYVAAPGQEVRFSVEAYDVDNDIERYEWDVDGDGTMDVTTTEPEVTWTYDSEWAGLAEVRAYSTDGGIGSAVASVTIASAGLTSLEPDTPTGLTAVASDGAEGARAVTLDWDPAATGGPVTHWLITDGAGTVLGAVDGAETSAVIANVPTGALTIGVRAANRYGLSSPAVVSLAAEGDDLDRLRADVLAAGLDRGAERSLVASLDAAIAALERGQLLPACRNLSAFRSKLESSAPHASDAQSSDWLDRSEHIADRLGC